MRPGTPATHLADDVPVADKKRRLNTLLALQERIGLARNEAWIGREVDVLVDTVTPPRSHEHDERARRRAARASPLTGRTREHKLIHLTGDPDARRADRRRPASTTPGRTRCAAPLVGA